VSKQGRPRKTKEGLEKADISGLIQEGERITGVYTVVRSDGCRSTVWTPAFEYTIFVKTSKSLEYLPWLATENGLPKVFKSFDRMLRLLREFGYKGLVTVYDESDPKRPIARPASYEGTPDLAAAE
jgi:hypothetical protein